MPGRVQEGLKFQEFPGNLIFKNVRKRVKSGKFEKIRPLLLLQLLKVVRVKGIVH